jgi:hypothetical protein
VVLVASITTADACDTGHWVQSVSSSGSVIELEDGSVWLVNPINQIDTMLWLPTAEIAVCGGTLVNTEEHEKAGATRVR